MPQITLKQLEDFLAQQNVLIKNNCAELTVHASKLLTEVITGSMYTALFFTKTNKLLVSDFIYRKIKIEPQNFITILESLQVRSVTEGDFIAMPYCVDFGLKSNYTSRMMIKEGFIVSFDVAQADAK